jgi:hypothetical protein
MSLNRPHTAISALHATEASATLAPLLVRMRESQEMWQIIQPLVPASLLGSVQPGKWEEGTWCLLVRSSASAAKLRQLQPALLDRLTSRGWKISAIRLKVQAAGS